MSNAGEIGNGRLGRLLITFLLTERLRLFEEPEEKQT